MAADFRTWGGAGIRLRHPFMSSLKGRPPSASQGPPRCIDPVLISGSNLPRPIPIRQRCGLGRSRAKPRLRCGSGRSCSNRFSRRRGWDTSPFSLYPAKGRYMWRDLERICAELDLPFRRPDPFPQMSVYAARVALVGLANNWGEEFCRAAYRAEFGEGRPIDDADLLAALLAGLGVDPTPALSVAQSPRSRAGCASRARRRNGSACSARRALSPQTAKFSGAMTGLKRPSPGAAGAGRRSGVAALLVF